MSVRYQDQLKLQNRRRHYQKLLWLLGVVFLILAGGVYALFFAGWFNVRTIAISGIETITPTELEGSVNDWLNVSFWNIKRRNNFLFLSVTDLSAALADKFPKIDLVNVSKKSTHELVVEIKERQPLGVWCLATKAQCFFFDSNGLAYQPTGPSSGFILLTVTDYREREINVGVEVTSSDWLADIRLAHDLLRRGNLAASEFIIPADSFDEFSVQIPEGWMVRLSTATDITQQLNALFNILKNKLTPTQRQQLEYVDLRIQDRVYYKLK